MSRQLALDAGFAYWIDAGAPIRAARDGSGQLALAPSTGGIGEIHVTNRSVIWVGDGVISEAPLTGTTTPRVLGNFTIGPFTIAVDDAHVFYAREQELVDISLDGTPDRVVSADQFALSVAIAGDELIGTSCAQTMGVLGLWRIAIAGGLRDELGPAFCPQALALDDYYVYTSDRVTVDGPLGIVRTPIEGGDPVLVVENQDLTFAVRDGFVYANQHDQIVRAAPDGTVTVLHDGRASGLAVDDTTLFWTDTSTGTLALHSAPLPDL